MCHFVSYIMYFQKLKVYRTPPGGWGEGGLLPAQDLLFKAFTFMYFQVCLNDDPSLTFFMPPP